VAGKKCVTRDLPTQVVPDQSVAAEDLSPALQDLCSPQLPLLVGLIASLTGQALQEDIAASAKAFLLRGQDILRMTPGSPPFSNHENHQSSLPSQGPARASPV
jgi:hypothetical protein